MASLSTRLSCAAAIGRFVRRTFEQLGRGLDGEDGGPGLHVAARHDLTQPLRHHLQV